MVPHGICPSWPVYQLTDVSICLALPQICRSCLSVQQGCRFAHLFNPHTHTHTHNSIYRVLAQMFITCFLFSFWLDSIHLGSFNICLLAYAFIHLSVSSCSCSSWFETVLRFLSIHFGVLFCFPSHESNCWMFCCLEFSNFNWFDLRKQVRMLPKIFWYY